MPVSGSSSPQFNTFYQGGGTERRKKRRMRVGEGGGREEEGGQRRYRRRDECSPCSRSLCLETRAWINRKYSCALLSLVPVTPSALFFHSFPCASHPLSHLPTQPSGAQRGKGGAEQKDKKKKGEHNFIYLQAPPLVHWSVLSLQHLATVPWDAGGKQRGVWKWRVVGGKEEGMCQQQQ